jgi:hypothetical protein
MTSELAEWGAAQRAWVDSGHRYTVHPSTQTVVEAILVLLFTGLLMGGASLIGNSSKPSLWGYLFIAFFTLGPTLGIGLLLQYRVRAGIFIDPEGVGRLNLLGNTSVTCPRASVAHVSIHRGSYKEWTRPIIGGPDDNVMWLMLRDGQVAMRTKMYFWTARELELLAAVLGVPLVA